MTPRWWEVTREGTKYQMICTTNLPLCFIHTFIHNRWIFLVWSGSERGALKKSQFKKDISEPEEREREGHIQVVQCKQKNLGYLELKMGEYSGLLLLVTMAAVVMSPSSVTADVIKVPDIPVDCAPPDVCATLRFYDANDNLLDWTMGTEKVLKPVKNVAKVQQIGTGSYTVFKGKNHKSVSACLSGNHIIDLKTEAYYDATVVKSVRYEHAGCPSMAGVPLWLVGAVIGVVVLVAVVIFVVMLRKRRAAQRGDPVPTKA